MNLYENQAAGRFDDSEQSSYADAQRVAVFSPENIRRVSEMVGRELDLENAEDRNLLASEFISSGRANEFRAQWLAQHRDRPEAA